MNRRDILKGLFGASVAAIIPLPLLLGEECKMRTIVATTTVKPCIKDFIVGRELLTDLLFSAEWPLGEGERKYVVCHVMREDGNKLLQFYLHPNGPSLHWAAMPGSEIIASPANSVYLEWDETPANVVALAYVRRQNGERVGIRSESNGNCFRVPVL